MGTPPPPAGGPLPLGSPSRVSSPSQKGSYVSDVKESPFLVSPSDLIITNGVARVSIPEELVVDASPLWKSFVVGRYMPHFAVSTKPFCHANVGRPPDVPGVLFSRKGLEFLSSTVGKFVKLHPSTERCTRLDVARILVEVNLQNTLTEKISFTGVNGEEVLGHKEKNCNNAGNVTLLEKRQPSVSATVQEMVQTLIKDLEQAAPFQNAIVSKPESVTVGVLEDDQWTTVSRQNKSSSPSSRVVLESLPTKPVSPTGFRQQDDKEEGDVLESESEEEEPDTTTLAYDVSGEIAPTVTCIPKPTIGRHRTRSRGPLKPISQRKDTRIKGFNLPRKHNVVKNWIQAVRPSFGCFLETHVQELNALSINTVSFCDLGSLSFAGPKFTWINNQDANPIGKKIDHALVNPDWLSHFPHSHASFEAGGISDHSWCLIHLSAASTPHRKPFKFFNFLTSHSLFLPTVANVWSQEPCLYHSRVALSLFHRELKALKFHMRELNRSRFGDLPVKCKEAYEEFCSLQAVALSSPTQANIIALSDATDRWQRLTSIEEQFFKQKSGIQWLRCGDQNTTSFHLVAQANASRNAIRQLTLESGVILTNPSEIKAENAHHFREFLQRDSLDTGEVAPTYLGDLLDYQCPESRCSDLISPVTREEIWHALSSLPSGKACGPDGYTKEFYISAWSIVGQDCVVDVQSFVLFGQKPRAVNATLLCLIPKNPKADSATMKDYRPISCCNILYKVISKILANRLKKILPEFVAPNQSAFIQGRLLLENVLLATELVKDYHKGTISSRSAIKFDISKAFDTVKWSFIISIFQALGFPDLFIKWIYACISTASFSVVVNGELEGFFASNRGVRQGCSLSPYIFVMLPVSCLDEVERLCSAFLWSGNLHTPTGAKVAWSKVCTPKQEGGLGLRRLQDVSRVFPYHLIWRLFTLSGSLWVAWARQNLMNHGCFWTAQSTTKGSWVWRKLLKLRDEVRLFIRAEVGNGELTSLWFDHWLPVGRILDITGPAGPRILGIPLHAKVKDAVGIGGSSASSIGLLEWYYLVQSSHSPLRFYYVVSYVKPSIYGLKNASLGPTPGLRFMRRIGRDERPSLFCLSVLLYTMDLSGG
ncbi:uncharacterized protein LOC111832379 [Capsella rubella]|uniref:uncharacterized protein LOC111832379 n=1 Tax=Capsella rubella TaxID=81985 RepID=UPI000CD56793|nr:uncharacterized protein LOC111832379 [Capsella rubella]